MSLLQTLLKQSKNPQNFIGRVILSIMNVAHSNMTRIALQKLNYNKDSVILDVGCGGGKTIETLSKLARHSTIVGLDYSQKAVEMSTDKNRKEVEGGRVKIIQGDVSSMPFPDAYFDVITAVQTHYFWPSLETDIKEIFRVLKPGGTFVIVSEMYKIKYHMKSYTTIDEMKQLYRLIGLQNITVEENQKWLFAAGSKAIAGE